VTTEPDTPVFREARLESPQQRPQHKEELSVSHRFSVKEEDLRASFVPESLEARDWLDGVQTTLYCRPEVERRIRQLVDEERNDFTKRKTFALVSGTSGSGRRFFTHQILQTIARENDGFFVCGKFDAIFQPIPYGAFLVCMSQYIHLLCERGQEEVLKFRALIQEHVGRNVAMLRSWLPSLERIMGPPDDDSSTEDGGKDRFARSLKMLRKAMSHMGYPTFTLLENIHFADQASLDLMVDLLRYPPKCGGFFVATCDSDVEPDSLVAMKLREIETLGLEIVEIVTQQSSEQRLVEALEGTDLVQKEPEKLAYITYQRSGGNLFLASLFLRWLHNKRILSRDYRTGTLVVDEDDIEVSFGHKMCKELLSDELLALPTQTREMLKVAACLGHEINAEFLGYVLDRDTRQIIMALQDAEEKGMVMQCAQRDAYCFSHDVVQKAAFALIAEADRPLFHAVRIDFLEKKNPTAILF
jgi:predicted ATPase